VCQRLDDGSRMSREAHVRFCEGPQVKFLRSTHPYLWTDEGWLYLAIVLDLFNREVVGWSLKPRMTADIVTDALTMAWFRRRPAPGLLHHSDRGSQYASHTFQDKLKAFGMTCSMSRKGNCWDNAPTESWFNSFKNERVHGIRYATHADMKAASFEYIEVFYKPQAAAFDPRLQIADSVPRELDQRAASGKTGSMKPTLWQTKNRRNLTGANPWGHPSENRRFHS